MVKSGSQVIIVNKVKIPSERLTWSHMNNIIGCIRRLRHSLAKDCVQIRHIEGRGGQRCRLDITSKLSIEKPWLQDFGEDRPICDTDQSCGP